MVRKSRKNIKKTRKKKKKRRNRKKTRKTKKGKDIIQSADIYLEFCNFLKKLKVKNKKK